MNTVSPSLLSVVLIFGLYRPSSGPIALRNVLKCSTLHTFFTIRFWYFSLAAFIEKTAERLPMLVLYNAQSIDIRQSTQYIHILHSHLSMKIKIIMYTCVLTCIMKALMHVDKFCNLFEW